METHDITDQEGIESAITAMLNEYQGPDFPIMKPESRKRYSRVLLVVGAGCLLGAIGTSIGVIEAITTRSSAPVAHSNADIKLVTLADNIKEADLIFIGDIVRASLSSDNEVGLPIVEYQVETVIKGRSSQTAILRYYPGVEDEYAADVGRRYLVFAHWENLGPDKSPILYPVGGPQSVYEVGDDGAATRADGDRIDIPQLITAIADDSGS